MGNNERRSILNSSNVTRNITIAAAIAALYVVLTYIANAMGLANNVIQVRFSEALTILPYFTVSAIPGVTIGCLLSNIMTGCALMDIIFGTFATFLGAVGTYALRKWKYMASVPPIAANTLIIPFVLRYAYGMEDAIWYMMLTVGAGEVISCGCLGMMLLFALQKKRDVLFGTGESVRPDSNIAA